MVRRNVRRFLKKYRRSLKKYRRSLKKYRRSLKKYRRSLKKYRRSLVADDRGAFCLARREYKNSLKNFVVVVVEQIDFISEKSERLWESVHTLSPKRKSFYK